MKFMEKAKRFFTLNAANHEGFTLVELIVVIAILAILAGVAVPAYSGYIKKAEKAGDMQLLGAVNEAFAAACMAEDVKVLNSTDADMPIVDGKIDIENIEPAEVVESFKLFYQGNEDSEFKVVTQLVYRPVEGVFVEWDEDAVIENLKQYISNSNYAGKLDELTGDVGTMIDVLSGYLGQQAIEDVDGSGFGDYMKDVLGMEEKDPDKMANAAVLYLAHTAANMTDENVMMAKGTLANALMNSENGLDAGVITALAEYTGSGLAGYAMLYATAEALAIQQGGDVYANLQNATINNPQDVLGVVSDVFNSVDDTTLEAYLGTDENSQYSKDMDAYFQTMQAVNGKEDELKGALNGGLLTENQVVLDLISKLK